MDSHVILSMPMTMRSLLLFVASIPWPSLGSAFSISSKDCTFQRISRRYGILDTFFEGIGVGKGDSNKGAQSERDTLKSLLVEQCKLDNQDLDDIRSTIDDLQQLSPISATASSPLLQKEWELIWTTEKEINFFLQNGFSDRITQEIDGTVLTNDIPFVRGGSFGVVGTLNIPDENGIRTEFVFDKAVLDIGKWGTYTLPPVGKGWFDTVYLDETLRVDVNSRNDILICRPS